jgi:hypothetical protein
MAITTIKLPTAQPLRQLQSPISTLLPLPCSNLKTSITHHLHNHKPKPAKQKSTPNLPNISQSKQPSHQTNPHLLIHKPVQPKFLHPSP